MSIELYCANCRKRLENEAYMFHNNFLQVKYFDDNKSNRFCSMECACESLMLDCIKTDDLPLDEDEKMGIDLKTLFSVLKNGCWIIGNHCNYTKNEVYFLKYKNGIDSVDFEEKRFIINEYPAQNEVDIHKLYFEDYGKTWALTKEELKDGKIC